MRMASRPKCARSLSWSRQGVLKVLTEAEVVEVLVIMTGVRGGTISRCENWKTSLPNYAPRLELELELVVSAGLLLLVV